MTQTDPDQAVAEAKSVLRKRMRTVRAEVSARNGDAAAQALKSQFMAQIDPQKLHTEGAVIAGYMALSGELDLEPTLNALLEHGLSLTLPVTGELGDALVFRAWRAGDALDMSRFGTLEPKPSAPVLEPDVILVPLLAFDVRGNRLGFGGGYYDRTLAELRANKKIAAYGIAFDEQEAEDVPSDVFDAPLNGIFTPSRFIPIAPKADA